MRRILPILVLSALAALAARPLAQSRQPMSIDDLITTVRVSDPQLSPDGKRVIYTRTTTDLASGRRNADIWSVPTDGSAAPSALISGDRTDNTPRFAPDAQHVLFISTRGEDAQVYVANADGTGVKAVTHVSGGVQAPMVVSPDGKKVAFVADVYPECPDDACNRQKREAQAKDPSRVRVLTSLGFRHWDEWRVGIRHHIFVADIASGEARDVTPGDFDSPPHFYEDSAITFSPDGASIVFVSNRDGRDKEMMSTNQDVWSVPVTGGTARKITNNPAADNFPLFSPDGKLLAVRSQRRAGFESDRWYIDVYDQASGAKRTLFEAPDLSVEEFTFSKDGDVVFFTAISQGSVNLYSVPVTGGLGALVLKGGTISSASAASNFLVFSKSTLTDPPDVYRATLEGVGAKKLTNENAAWLSQRTPPAVESQSASGAGVTPVQYWLMKPPGFDASKKYPAVFLIHGGPQGAWDDGWSYRWNPALWAAQGWVVAAPNPRGSFGFGQRFVDEISQDWCGKVMTDLNAVFDSVGKLPYVDPQRLGIAGASYGGYAVDWIIGHDNRFKAAVSHDGVFNLETMSLESEELWFTDWESGGPPTSQAARKHFARCSPHLFADKIKTPTLVITNEQDFRVPVDQGLQLFTALRRNGVPSEALVFSDEGHWVLGALNSKRWHEEVFGWMKRYLEK
jgi:dipeptidyl aminopeptidase/acylaminoacyl peptidase